jgi:MFS family permease
MTRNVLALGLVSLFTDTATEIVVPLLPVFLTTTLGAGALALGWIEGTADAVASLLKLVSGRVADRLGRNRPLVLAGYALSSIARPVIALAAVPAHVLAVRVTDRVGKGLRTSPRDSLLARSVPEKARGTAYGFHRAMDHAGAVLGPLLAIGFLTFVSTDLRLLFALTAVPGVLAVAAILIGVREIASKEKAATAATGEPLPAGRLARFLVPLAVFTLGNASDVFLLLKAGTEKVPLIGLPLLWMAFHVVKMLSATPGGRLSDRIGRRRTIALGWSVYALVYAGLAVTTSRAAIAALFIVYGLYHGLTEGAEKALVADLAPAGARGTAFGWYHATIGILALPAGLLFGGLWERFGPATAFATGAGLAFAALALLVALSPGRAKEGTLA